MYNYQCEHCGAYLDPGEKCDCAEKSVADKTLKGEAIYVFRKRELVRINK